jgi:hypothetical protein
MAENITILADNIMEGTTPKITATIQDEDGSAIDTADITTLTLNLYNLDDTDNTIINSRSDQDVHNTNNVTVSSAGALVWSVQALDTIMVGSDLVERHRAVFKWTYSSGTKTGSYVIDMAIRNLEKVT